MVSILAGMAVVAAEAALSAPSTPAAAAPAAATVAPNYDRSSGGAARASAPPSAALRVAMPPRRLGAYFAQPLFALT
eukprot:gene909-3934_t